MMVKHPLEFYKQLKIVIIQIILINFIFLSRLEEKSTIKARDVDLGIIT